MRLAYAIAFTRSVWWSMFFVYGPLFMVKAGYGPLAAAAMVSAGNAMLFFAMMYGRMARATGVRPIVVGAYVATSATTILIAILSHLPAVAVVLLVVGAFCATALLVACGVSGVLSGAADLNRYRLVGDAIADPHHPARQKITSMLETLAYDLRSSPEMRAKVERLTEERPTATKEAV